MPQEFVTADRLRLEVLNDPPAGYFRDYIPNPTGDLGGWGWLSPIDHTRAAGGFGVVNLQTVTAQSGVYFTTEAMPVRAGATHLRLGFTRYTGLATIGVKGRVDFYDADAALISSTAYSALLATDGANATLAGRAIPAGTVTLKARFDLTRAGAAALNAGDNLDLNNVHLAQGTLTEMNGGSVALENGWTDILGAAGALDVDRSELNLGVITGTLYAPELDPAVADTIRKGKALRLLVDVRAFELATPDFTPLFTGEILNATVDYNLAHPDPDKRTKITLTAVDPTKTLTALGRPDGVSSVAELAHVLEGCGLPWNLNGDTGHDPTTPPIVARNDNAKAIDQIAIVRDSVLGYAWVSRAGVVNVWDAAELPALDFADAVLDEDAYADATVDYDLDRCINIVTLKYLRLDPVTGDTEEIAYGPYVDLASRNEWGPHEAEFTVQGLEEDPAALQAYAEAILAANATPVRRITAATVYLRTAADLLAWSRLDLYDAVRCVAARADLDLTQRVTGLKHTITAGAADSVWRLDVEFGAEGGVAPPQQVPSPPATGAATLAQLLRPVGECSIMLGLPSQVWPGWLVLNGAALTAGEYPELEAWLAAAGLPTTVLPDFTDRLPVAAGIKALGAKSGAWAKNVPPHVHQMTEHTHGAGAITTTTQTNTATGGTATRVTALSGVTAGVTGGAPPNSGPAVGATFDVTPPVIGVYYVIRAKSGV